MIDILTKSEPDRYEIAKIVKEYKDADGNADYLKLMSISQSERIPELVKTEEGEKKMVGVVTAAITIMGEELNIKSGLKPGQVVSLAAAIIEQAEYERLTLEDVIVFLQQVSNGYYGEMYNALDRTKILKWMGTYREARVKSLEEYRINKHIEYKGLGDSNRSVEPDKLTTYVDTIAGRFNALKDYRPNKDAPNINSETFKSKPNNE